ncbi:PTS transporter subunit EIIB [Georgenia wangjunii]|uniref:PTS transporter subunit EIIB n=1 Tax=Georgenia wangjunii TaxID=3117730 RepID=UPI002F26CEE0
MKDIQHILAGLGGVENVREIEPCVTRLRAEVENPDHVDPRVLRSAGCHGVLVRGRVVQVVVGPEADLLASDLAELTWGVLEPGE